MSLNFFLPYFVGDPDIKIERIDTNERFNNFIFKITTSDGIVYEFETFGKTNTSVSDDPMDPTIYISTWYLSKIVTPKGDEIFFSYENMGKSYPLRSFTQVYQVGNNTGFREIKGPQATVDNIYLKEIKFKGNKVVFNFSEANERKDIKTDYFLKNMQVFEGQNKIKEIAFNYSYFGAETLGNNFTIENGDYASVIGVNAAGPSLNLRLKLLSIIENEDKIHSFDYFDRQDVGIVLIPNKTSMSQDYWGYFNGIINKTSFIPHFKRVDQTTLGTPKVAKRYPVASKAKLFSLRRLTYPTKGVVEFEYESNTYNHDLNDFEYDAFYSYIYPAIAPIPSLTSKVETISTSGGAAPVSKQVDISSATNVVFTASLAIPYSNVSADPNNTPNRMQHPFDYSGDMYVQLINASTGEEIRIFRIPSDSGSLQFEQEGSMFYVNSIELPAGSYVMKVYFNDHDQLYFGQAQAKLTWEEGDTGEKGEEFSFGGGLRIASVSDFDYDGTLLRKQSYDYHYKELNLEGEVIEKSYGLIKEVPHFKKQAYPTTIVTDGGTSSMLVAQAHSQHAFSKNLGSYVGYKQVTATNQNFQNQTNGKKVYKFYSFLDFLGFDYTNHTFSHEATKFAPIRLPHDGKLKKEENYKLLQDGTYEKVSEVEYKYLINGVSSENFGFQEFFKTSNYVLSGWAAKKWTENVNSNPFQDIFFQFYPYYIYDLEIASEETTQYFKNGILETENNYTYDNPKHHLPTKTN